MACTDCGIDCYLVDSKCVCSYTPLKGFTEQELTDCYFAANAALSGITGDCDLCDGFGEEGYLFTTLIATKTFRAYYANLVYSFWLQLHGAGSPTKEGFTTKESDDYSNFRVNTEKEITAKIDRHNSVLEMYKRQFIEAFKETNESCIECETTCTTCDSNNCTCENKIIDGSSLDIFGYKTRSDYSTDDMATI